MLNNCYVYLFCVLGLRPLFLIHGPMGVGKSLLLSCICSYLGIKYWRINCLEYGDVVPGQAEGKIKALFAQLKKQSPCLLHLDNIQVGLHVFEVNSTIYNKN